MASKASTNRLYKSDIRAPEADCQIAVIASDMSAALLSVQQMLGHLDRMVTIQRSILSNSEANDWRAYRAGSKTAHFTALSDEGLYRQSCNTLLASDPSAVTELIDKVDNSKLPFEALISWAPVFTEADRLLTGSTNGPGYQSFEHLVTPRRRAEILAKVSQSVLQSANAKSGKISPARMNNLKALSNPDGYLSAKLARFDEFIADPVSTGKLESFSVLRAGATLLKHLDKCDWAERGRFVNPVRSTIQALDENRGSELGEILSVIRRVTGTNSVGDEVPRSRRAVVKSLMESATAAAGSIETAEGLARLQVAYTREYDRLDESYTDVK